MTDYEMLASLLGEDRMEELRQANDRDFWENVEMELTITIRDPK